MKKLTINLPERFVNIIDNYITNNPNLSRSFVIKEAVSLWVRDIEAAKRIAEVVTNIQDKNYKRKSDFTYNPKLIPKTLAKKVITKTATRKKR